MTNFVMLGSCRFEPYNFLAVPNMIPGAWNTDAGYAIAAKVFYPAMDKADVIIVYAPDGIGKHTQLDIDYARSIGKKVFALKALIQMDHGQAFMLKKVQLAKASMTTANIGDNVIKFAKSVLVCNTCQTQVEISGFHKSDLPIYKCVKDTCPAFGKTRNLRQRHYLEYEQSFEYRKVGIIQ